MSYVYPPYEKQIKSSGALNLRKSVEFLRAADSHDYCEVIEVGMFNTGNEYIIVNLDIQRAQEVVNDIREQERILIEFQTDEDALPYVYALREDFPDNVSHLNLGSFDKPKSLCLYDIPADHVNLSWTGIGFIETIRMWLRLTAEGELHQGDQPLEPFFLDTCGNIILPYPLDRNREIKLWLKSNRETSSFNFVGYYDQLPSDNADNAFHLLPLWADQTVHGRINSTPTNFQELVAILEKYGIDLIENLDNLLVTGAHNSKKLLILLLIPTLRDQGGEAESLSKYAFLIDLPIRDISIKTELLVKVPDSDQWIPALTTFITPDEKAAHKEVAKANGADIPIFLIKPHFNLDKTLARRLNGDASEGEPIKICQIGLGALGSAIFDILSRGGFGDKFTLVDHDILLPHNLTRHALRSIHVGHFKSEALAFEGNLQLSSANYVIPYCEKVDRYLSDETLNSIFEDADLIIDTSASVPTARFLNHLGTVHARRTSIFTNPSGKALIILAEDTKRETKLNSLEALYYNEIYQNALLKDHLQTETGVRYSGGCRDISLIMPNENLAVFSGLASKMIKKLRNLHESFATIWTIDEESNSVIQYPIEIVDFEAHQLNGWTLFISTALIKKLQKFRDERLPNETGGILIGSTDTASREIYVINTILSPVDSVEFPYSYLRGVDGLENKIEHIEEVTAKNLTYVGEWHSHPDQSSVQQSSDDLKFMGWIKEVLHPSSKPAIMLICGKDEFGVYLE